MTDDEARGEMLVSAVQITLDESVGDPDAIVKSIAHVDLDEVRRSMWWATLLDGVRSRDVSRITIAAAVLLFGEPEVETTYGWAAA